MARSSSASESKSKAAELIRANTALAADPADVSALARVVAVLGGLGNKSLSARAYEALSASAREGGQFALALYAAASLEKLGDARSAKSLRAEIARAYAKGSARVDASVRPKPPAPATKAGAGAGGAEKAGGGAAANDVQAAMKVTAEAVAKALAHAGALAKKAGPLPQVPLAASLEAAGLETLCGLMKPRSQKAGDVVVDVGDDADALYLVARGSLEVSRGGETVGRLGAGAFFGEIALLAGTRRTAKVACLDETWLLEVPRKALEDAAGKSRGLADTLARYARSRLLATTMRTTEIFKRLDTAERDLLVPRFEPSLLAAGDKPIKAGEEGERLHVVVSGELEVKDGGKVIGRLGPGDVFGEMSLLGRRPATADVVASARTVTLSLTRAKFDDVAMKHPELLAEVYRLIVEREAKNRAGGAAEEHEVSADDLVV